MARPISIALVVVLIIVVISAIGVAAYYSTLKPSIGSSSSPSTSQLSTSSLITTSQVSASNTTVLASASSSISSVASSGSLSTTSSLANQTTSSSGCPALATTNSTEGLTLKMYLPNSASIGDQVCVTAVLASSNQTTISSISGNITVTEQNGSVVFESALVPFQAGSVTLSYGNQLSFQFLWNTTQSYAGVTAQPGTYTVKVYVQFHGMQPLTYIDDTANMTLSRG